MQKTACQYLFSFKNGGPLKFAIYKELRTFRNFISKYLSFSFFIVNQNGAQDISRTAQPIGLIF